MQKGAARAAAAGMAFDTGEVGRLADNFRYVRFGSLADILTSPRHVRFTPNNGRWAAHPSQLWLSVYEYTP